MTAIFTDLGETLEDFAETIYVRCPRCQKRAHVSGLPAHEEIQSADDARHRFQQSWLPRKLSCLHCSYISTWKGTVQRRGGPYDWYFRLPLWLQTPCCGEILWAFNEEHLSFLERCITATQRIKFHAEGQLRNGTMASRLPIWMKRAKNRDAVIKGIEQLKVLLEEA